MLVPLLALFPFSIIICTCPTCGDQYIHYWHYFHCYYRYGIVCRRLHHSNRGAGLYYPDWSTLAIRSRPDPRRRRARYLVVEEPLPPPIVGPGVAGSRGRIRLSKTKTWHARRLKSKTPLFYFSYTLLVLSSRTTPVRKFLINCYIA